MVAAAVCGLEGFLTAVFATVTVADVVTVVVLDVAVAGVSVAPPPPSGLQQALQRWSQHRLAHYPAHRAYRSPLPAP